MSLLKAVISGGLIVISIVIIRAAIISSSNEFRRQQCANRHEGEFRFSEKISNFDEFKKEVSKIFEVQKEDVKGSDGQIAIIKLATLVPERAGWILGSLINFAVNRNVPSAYNENTP